MMLTDINIKERILQQIEGVICDFLYYDRKECHLIPLGEIEKAIQNEEISLEDIVSKFKQELEKSLCQQKKI